MVQPFKNCNIKMVKAGLVLLLSVAFASTVFEPHANVISQEMVDSINNDPTSTWEAHMDWAGEMTVE